MQDTQNNDKLFTDLQNFVKTESVLGSPVPVGGKTLVPVVSVTMGYGSGSNKKENAAKNGGTGIGLGARIATNAVVVIDKDSVSMLPIDAKGMVNNQQNGNSAMSNLVNKIPDMITNFTQGGQQQGSQQQGGQQQGGQQQGGQQQGQSQNMGQNQLQNQAQNMGQNQQQNQGQSMGQNQSQNKGQNQKKGSTK